MKKLALTYLVTSAAALTLGLVGCTLVGPAPVPPSKGEQAIYDIKTNVVLEVVTKTNMVQVQVPVEVYHTNEVGMLITNVVQIPQLVPQYVTITNRTEQYTYTPNQLATQSASAAGAIGNAVVPGIGGIVAGIITGVLTMWGKLRSSKTVGTTLAQNIQTMREFLKNHVPNGEQYDGVLTKFMQQHQAEEGVLQQVLGIISASVSNKDAQAAAQEIRNAIVALQAGSQPPTVAPVTPTTLK